MTYRYIAYLPLQTACWHTACNVEPRYSAKMSEAPHPIEGIPSGDWQDALKSKVGVGTHQLGWPFRMPPNLRNTACFIWWVLVLNKKTPKWEHSRDSYLYYISVSSRPKKKTDVCCGVVDFCWGPIFAGRPWRGQWSSSSESLACDLALPLENRSQRGQWCYSLVITPCQRGKLPTPTCQPTRVIMG